MTWREGHFTFLYLTLQTFRLVACSSWCYFRKFWTVGCSHWSTILIYTFDCDWIWFTNKLFVWSEGHTSVWCNRVGSLTWNRFLFASICEGWLYCFIDWNQWITTLEAWSACLWDTLRTCAGCTGSCRSHLSKLWTVSRSNWSTILIHTFHCDWIWVSNKLLVWGESYSSV